MIETLQKRLDQFNATDPLSEEQALKQILQEVSLYALWRIDFFKIAAFQGGTSLRILHGLPRFSEDLDFILIKPWDDFSWMSYEKGFKAVMNEFGIQCEFSDRGKMDRVVREAMLKDDSIAHQLNVSFSGNPNRKLKVKMEIDTNPLAGSGFEYRSGMNDFSHISSIR